MPTTESQLYFREGQTAFAGIAKLQTAAAVAMLENNPLAQKKTISPCDLHGCDLVALAPNETARREADRVFAEYGASPNIVAETAFSSTVCAMVLEGLGCGLVDPDTTPGFTDRGLILRRLDPQVKFRILVLFPPQKKSKLVNLLYECLCAVNRAQQL